MMLARAAAGGELDTWLWVLAAAFARLATPDKQGWVASGSRECAGQRCCAVVC